MLFNSFQFLVFLPLVTFAYFAIKPKYRWMLLLAASYYFYMCWKAEYIILIIISTLIDYFASLAMGRTENKRKRKIYLSFSLLGNLGLLFFFKYYNFLNSSLSTLFNHFNIMYNMPAFDYLLPAGISFYTFQTLSYTIEVYRGNQKPEKHLGIFALYVSFFPQLVAGPIERSQNLLPQFYKVNTFNYERTIDGIKLILWGFFKKVVIADRVAVAVNQVFNNPHDHLGIHFIIATFLFTIQIYCDFSAYSDIAIGSAKIMGYDLMTNFKRPFFSKSVAELWQRWHISLTSWFKDYIYIPLGGNRVSKFLWYRNILIVFIISGFWHGANWTFVFFGLLQGIFLVAGILTASFRDKFWNIIGFDKFPILNNLKKVVITFSLFSISLSVFRSNSITDSYYILTHFFDGLGIFLSNIGQPSYWRSLFSAFGMPESEIYIALLSIVILFIVEFIEEKKNFWENFKDKPIFLRWSFYYAIIISILFFGAYNSGQQFIYFQF